MREILFRGKSSLSGKWHYGSLIVWEDGNMDILHSEENESMDKTRVDPETVGQFTGLTDCNGTKIFEGDIVEETGLYNCGGTAKPYSKKAAAVFDDSICGFKIPIYYDGLVCHNNKQTVIGNIHDDPELIK